MSKESIKNTISLMLITLIAGLLLGAVYEITKEPIAKENQRAKEEAYKAVFADAGSFEEINLDTDQVQKELDSQGLDASINEAMKVLDGSGQQLGYVLTVTDHEGYGGDIQFAMGVQSDGTLNGISFLSISETAGLGMKAKEDSFRKQFEGKNVDQIVYTKNGASADNEIDALSGATITTNAVTNGVNAGLYYVHTLQ
ncbi:MAG: RnfABCDGE type electron transport complex subunit G [Clostridiales bacterium]|nr:RnfABCDGE type electron transport complex subunit G [Clostridiales bacterium]